MILIVHASTILGEPHAPTLDQLVGDRDTWDDAGQQDDVQFWLEVNASQSQLTQLAQHVSPAASLTQDELYWRQPALELTPAQLLSAWHYVVGPAPSDFTDDEWELLASRFPPRKDAYGRTVDRRAYELVQRRRSYDGIRYKFANKIPWSHLPRRYGGEGTVYQRFFLDKKNGVFAYLAQSLRDTSEAVELVAWLNRLIDDNRP